jgi:hypothetical protein
MKTPQTSEAMFTIANKYARPKEVTLDTRGQKKEKDSCQADQPSSSKGHDKKENGRDTTRSTGPGWVNLKASWIASAFLTPRESTRRRTTTDSKLSQMKYSRWPKEPIRRKSLKNLRATSPKLRRRSTTAMVALILMSHGGSRNSQPGRSWRSHPPPPSTLSGPRSPSPSTAVTTWTLGQSWGCILS